MDDFEYAMGGSPETNPFSLSDYSIGTIISFVLLIILIIVNIVAFIKFFKKMGYHGWKAIIPVYNFMVLAEMGDMKKVLGLLYFIPIANFIFLFKTYKVIANKMKLPNSYPILLTFLSFIFIPLIAFNSKITCAEEFMHKEEVPTNLDSDKVSNLDDLLGNNNVQDPNNMNAQPVQNTVDPNMVNAGQPMMNNQGMMPNNMNAQPMPNTMDPNMVNAGQPMMNNQNMMSNNMNGQMMNNMNQPMMNNQNMAPNNMNQPAMNNQNMAPNNMNQPTMNNQGMMPNNNGAMPNPNNQPNGVFDPNNFGNQ